MFLGVLASFLGATFQAVNYTLTQSCQQRYNIDGVKLLVAVHVGLGFVALIPTLLFGYWKLLAVDQWWDFIKINLPYLLAQYSLIKAIRLSDASIVSPLLALKIPVLALISILFFQADFGAMQWLAISLILALGWYFSSMSGQITLAPLMLVLFSSVGYSLSDMAITQFSHRLLEGTSVEQSLATISINYLALGVCSLPLLKLQKVNLKTVYQTKWVALAWFVAVVFLILGFNIAGVVSGNVVQSLRGVIGVILAFVFFRTQIDQPMSVWKKKLMAATGMFIAVGLFYS
ncbi:EamA family transporter [Vibrio sp. JC009]|uniref:EamA family transporter n=1 Tax=Vibrio sp. JC009 TaxID=2912314 RepID=UPI0023AF1840|nr:EamA family transporter [Vibrio sp. JC009]WED23647.1 EamA family transporter [Vibrio sp. JC009]